MKNSILKKAVSLLLAIVMIFGVSSISFAASDNEDTVATITFYCYVKNPGHCWIYVENLSDSSMMIGAYELQAGEGVSVGTFGVSRYDGYGIYYNIESYCQNEYGLTKTYTTLTEELTLSEVEKLSDAILSTKNTWSVFNNCVTFAVKMWNLVSDKHLGSFVFPFIVKIQMLLKGCTKNAPVMKAVSADEVYKQKGTGSDAYLKTVSKISLGSIW